MSDPANAFTEQILNQDALAQAPVGNEQEATPAAPLGDEQTVTPQSALGGEGAALPLEATGGIIDDEARLREVRELLKRTGGYNNSSVNAVFRAAEIFNRESPGGRTVSELMLGLVWACEGYPRFSIDLDEEVLGQGGYILIHKDVMEANRWAVKITAIGLWNCGLDDIFKLRDEETKAALDDTYSRDVALKRWQRNLARYAGWNKDVPFRDAKPGELKIPDLAQLIEISPGEYVTDITPGDYVINFDEDDAVGFLVAVAARFMKQLSELPAALEARGYHLNIADIKQLSETEPVLAYATYQTSAIKAAAYFEVAVFVREFSEAVSDSVITSGEDVHLKPVIEVINKWLAKLKNESNVQNNIGLGWGVKTLLRNPEGITALRAVTRKKWELIPAEEGLSGEERALLERVQQTWADYALYVSAHFAHKPPGEFLGRGSLDNTARKLIRTDEAYGFGIQNMAQRFVQVNPDAPLGTTDANK